MRHDEMRERKLLKKVLHKESRLVAGDSLEVLEVFEQFEDAIPEHSDGDQERHSHLVLRSFWSQEKLRENLRILLG